MSRGRPWLDFLFDRSRSIVLVDMTDRTCSCDCHGCVALHPRGDSTSNERMVLLLTDLISRSLRDRGIEGDAKEVELVLARATVLVRWLAQLVEDPHDADLVDRASRSVEMLAANLAAVVGDRPQLS